MVTKTATKTPLIDNLALKLARLYYQMYRADAREVRQLAELHSNPPSLSEDFLEGKTILPAAQHKGGTRCGGILRPQRHGSRPAHR